MSKGEILFCVGLGAAILLFWYFRDVIKKDIKSGFEICLDRISKTLTAHEEKKRLDQAAREAQAFTDQKARDDARRVEGFGFGTSSA